MRYDSRPYNRCVVPGCTTLWSSLKRFQAEHEAKPHVRCTCSWVGVYWRQHRAQRARWGFDVSQCAVLENVNVEV